MDGIGLMPYRERLKRLDLTTLIERRARGDLIETFKIVSGVSNYGKNMFKLSRSGLNLVIPPGKNTGFFSSRVVPYWNKLPPHVKKSKSVDMFKSQLETYKKSGLCNNVNVIGHFWELSEQIFCRINDENRDDHVKFLIDNPHIAKLKKTNIH